MVRAAFRREDELLLVETRDGRAQIVERRRVPRLGGAAISSDGRLVYFANERSLEGGSLTPRVQVFDDTGEILVADGEQVCSVLFRGDVLYLGGSRVGPFLKKADEEWDEDRVVQRVLPCVRARDLRARVDLVVELPPVDKYTGCAVDALALDGDRLYAFDNVMLPIFLFELDVSEPTRPRARAVRDVSHGLWARVRGAAMCAGFCVALQLEASQSGTLSTLAVFEVEAFRSVASLTEATAWTALAVDETRAFIASERGVGVVDLGRLAEDPARPLVVEWHDVGRVDDLRLSGSTLTLFRDADPPAVWTLQAARWL